MLRGTLKSLRHGFHSQGTCKLMYENTLCTEETNAYLPFKRLIDLYDETLKITNKTTF